MANNPSLNAVHVLVVDDEPDLRTLYELTLLREGYQVTTAGSLGEARQLLDSQSFSLVITDMRLPDGMGIDLVHQIRQSALALRCIVITAYGSAENAVESLKAGAFDYLTKPVDLKQFRAAVVAAVQTQEPPVVATTPARARNTQKTPALPRGQEALERLVGTSSAMDSVRERILKVAKSMAPVLVRGESGTGKELVASALHANSHRADGPWIAVNCGAIPENLLEVEFFGARKGAYTGASHDREGFFRAAHGGTLFLDEIGDLPIAMQSKLLRAIQERSIRPVGGTQEEPVDVRLVSATHKDLVQEIAAGRFRQDLFYRLNVIDIVIPPLRERMSDLAALCETLLSRIARDSGTLTLHLGEQDLELLKQLPLHGNVRELENLLHRAVALSEGGALRLADALPAPAADTTERPPAAVPAEPVSAPPHDLQGHLDQQEREILVRTLKETHFNRTVAAQRLGLSLRQMRYRIARLKIDMPANQEEAGDA